jgi:TonB family protein
MIETMNAAAVRPEWVGSFAGGRFPLLRWLGGSQDAGVFLTELGEPGQKAIIKLIPADAEDAEAREAAWAAAEALSHPNLMKVYAHGRYQIDDVPCLYVVTEFADEVLAEILSERPLTTQETRDLLSPVLDALSYLHAKGLVHGRLRPSNIMAAGDRLKLSTDGLSFAGASAGPRSAQTVYDAPKAELGTIAPAADIWSLGATLVEILTKYPPVWNRARAAEPTVPESMPEPFASIARKCLRSDPARRSTIEAIAARLEPAKSPSRSQEKPEAASPARRRVAVLFAVVALVLAGIGIWYALSHRAQPPSATQEAQNAPAATPAPAPSATPAVATGPATNPVASSAQPPAPPTSPVATSPVPPAAAPVPIAASAPVTAPAPPPQPESQVDQTPAPGGSTVNPAIVNQILPDILPSALKTINGTLRVSVQLEVDANGAVTSVALLSPGPSKYFAGKSLEAARHWKFKPAQVNGNAAPSAWTLNFQFRQSGIQVIPERTTP